MWPGQGLGVKRWGTGDSDSGKKECTRDETSNLPWELPGLRRARQLCLRVGEEMEGGVEGIRQLAR